MTVLTMPAQPGQEAGAPPRPVPWRRMIWVTWRQHRATFISVPAVLAVAAVILVAFGLKVRRDYAPLVHCPVSGPVQSGISSHCSPLFSAFNGLDWPLGNTAAILMQLAPVLIGAFAGAPLLARELETGTFRYAWTQGLPRERQAVAKLVVVGVTLAVLGGAFGQLFAWFFQPFLYTEQMNVMTETVFATRGLVFPVFTLVSFTIGAFLGMLLRRVIPALAATLGVYLVLRLAAWGVRGHYPVSVVTSNASQFGDYHTPSLPGFPWILSTWFTGPDGKPASQSVVSAYLSNPNPNAKLPPGYTEWNRYIPFSHFWPMQFIEAGWLLVLAIAFGAGAVWLARRRAA
jgi:ABC-type transport system involved in multi-copper enzyme maturation permease subunit